MAAGMGGKTKTCGETGKVPERRAEPGRAGKLQTEWRFRKIIGVRRSVVPTRAHWNGRNRLAIPNFPAETGLPWHEAPAFLAVADFGGECVSSAMNIRLACMLGSLAVFALPLSAEEAPVAEEANGKEQPAGLQNGIPADLLDDPHVREELAVNEFTAPSISKLFDTLQFLMPLPLLETGMKLPERMPLDRADLAIELGFLIADGFLVVQAEQLEKVEDLAKELTRYGKALGAGDRVNRHAASLLDSAKNKDVAQLKKELTSTQRDVEAELVTLRDADLAHLISLGGWIRALSVSTVAVDKQFSEERARKVMREDIADYYTESVAGLEPRIAERANYLAMRNLLAGLRTEMTLEDGEAPTPEMMKEIRVQAAKLVELALQRNQ